MNHDAPAARYVLTADQLRQLEAAWGERLPDGFGFVWSDDVPSTERERRDQAAREALRDTGLLVPGPDGLVEPHVRRFLEVLRRPTVVVAAQAWTRQRHWLELVACDARWGTSLRRTRRPAPETAVPSSPGPNPDPVETPWADEDAIHLTLAQRGTVLARPLDLFDHVRRPADERTVDAEPVGLNLAESVAAVAACRPGRNPEVAYELLRQVGADRSGEPFRSLAAGLDAGFEVTVTAPGLAPRHGLYVSAWGLWVSLAARTDPALAPVGAGQGLSGPALADATTVRLAATTASHIVADYLTTVTALQTAQQQEADQ